MDNTCLHLICIMRGPTVNNWSYLTGKDTARCMIVAILPSLARTTIERSHWDNTLLRSIAICIVYRRSMIIKLSEYDSESS